MLDGGVVVFDGVAGVEPQSETVWRQADRYAVPRICFVNKMDRTGADFERTLQMIVDRLGAVPVPLQLPMGAEAKFEGVVDLVQMLALRFRGERGEDITVEEIPAELQAAARAAHDALVECVAEHDDQLMVSFLEGHEIHVVELQKAIRRATISNAITPVLTGSALRNKGVQPLLDAVVTYLPSPVDVPPITAHNMTNLEETVEPPRGGRRAADGARLQGCVGPVRRPARVLPRLLRRRAQRRPGAEQHAQPSPSVSGGCCACTPTRARTSRRCSPARSRRRSASRTRSPATR